MTQIILSGEQAAALHSATQPIQLIDSAGRVVGVANSLQGAANLSPQEILALESLADSEGPWYSGDEVRERLERLNNP
jgi:hypothetical protein